MTKIQRWGLVGTSRISHDFARALKRTPGAILQAVTSRNPDNAARFAREHGVTTAHSSFEAFLSDPAIDIVYLSAPTHLHHTLGLAILDSNKHLLCEKPFTTNETQAAAVIKKAKDRALFCMEAMWIRFNGAIAQCREDLAASRLGQLSLITVDVGYGKPLDQLGGPREGRGAACVFGCYGLNLALFLFGQPKEVRSISNCDTAGVDVDTAYLLGYDSYLVSVNASVGATLSNELRLYGSKAKILVPAPFLDATERILIDGNSSPWPRRLKILADPINRRLPSTKAMKGSGLRGEAAEVMRCLQLGLLESPVMPLEHTLVVQRLMATSIS